MAIRLFTKNEPFTKSAGTLLTQLNKTPGLSGQKQMMIGQLGQRCDIHDTLDVFWLRVSLNKRIHLTKWQSFSHKVTRLRACVCLLSVVRCLYARCCFSLRVTEVAYLMKWTWLAHLLQKFITGSYVWYVWLESQMQFHRNYEFSRLPSYDSFYTKRQRSRRWLIHIPAGRWDGTKILTAASLPLVFDVNRSYNCTFHI